MVFRGELGRGPSEWGKRLRETEREVASARMKKEKKTHETADLGSVCLQGERKRRGGKARGRERGKKEREKTQTQTQNFFLSPDPLLPLPPFLGWTADRGSGT